MSANAALLSGRTASTRVLLLTRPDHGTGVAGADASGQERRTLVPYLNWIQGKSVLKTGATTREVYVVCDDAQVIAVSRSGMRPLPFREPILSVACGFEHSLFLSRHGGVVSMGRDYGTGALGLPGVSETSKPRPVVVLGGRRVTAVSAYGFRSGAIANRQRESSAVLWGVDCADPAEVLEWGPESFPSDGRLVDLSLGPTQALALTSSGDAFYWGSHDDRGRDDVVSRPHHVGGGLAGEPVQSIFASPGQSFAITRRGKAFFWGRRKGFTQRRAKAVPAGALVRDHPRFPADGMPAPGCAWCDLARSDARAGDGDGVSFVMYNRPIPIAEHTRWRRFGHGHWSWEEQQQAENAARAGMLPTPSVEPVPVIGITRAFRLGAIVEQPRSTGGAASRQGEGGDGDERGSQNDAFMFPEEAMVGMGRKNRRRTRPRPRDEDDGGRGDEHIAQASGGAVDQPPYEWDGFWHCNVAQPRPFESPSNNVTRTPPSRRRVWQWASYWWASHVATTAEFALVLGREDPWSIRNDTQPPVLPVPPVLAQPRVDAAACHRFLPDDASAGALVDPRDPVPEEELIWRAILQETGRRAMRSAGLQLWGSAVLEGGASLPGPSPVAGSIAAPSPRRCDASDIPNPPSRSGELQGRNESRLARGGGAGGAETEGGALPPPVSLGESALGETEKPKDGDPSASASSSCSELEGELWITLRDAQGNASAGWKVHASWVGSRSPWILQRAGEQVHLHRREEAMPEAETDLWAGCSGDLLDDNAPEGSDSEHHKGSENEKKRHEPAGGAAKKPEAWPAQGALPRWDRPTQFCVDLTGVVARALWAGDRFQEAWSEAGLYDPRRLQDPAGVGGGSASGQDAIGRRRAPPVPQTPALGPAAPSWVPQSRAQSLLRFLLFHMYTDATPLHPDPTRDSPEEPDADIVKHTFQEHIARGWRVPSVSLAADGDGPEEEDDDVMKPSVQWVGSLRHMAAEIGLAHLRASCDIWLLHVAAKQGQLSESLQRLPRFPTPLTPTPWVHLDPSVGSLEQDLSRLRVVVGLFKQQEKREAFDDQQLEEDIQAMLRNVELETGGGEEKEMTESESDHAARKRGLSDAHAPVMTTEQIRLHHDSDSDGTGPRRKGHRRGGRKRREKRAGSSSESPTRSGVAGAPEGGDGRANQEEEDRESDNEESDGVIPQRAPDASHNPALQGLLSSVFPDRRGSQRHSRRRRRKQQQASAGESTAAATAGSGDQSTHSVAPMTPTPAAGAGGDPAAPPGSARGLLRQLSRAESGMGGDDAMSSPAHVWRQTVSLHRNALLRRQDSIRIEDKSVTSAMLPVTRTPSAGSQQGPEQEQQHQQRGQDDAAERTGVEDVVESVHARPTAQSVRQAVRENVPVPVSGDSWLAEAHAGDMTRSLIPLDAEGLLVRGLGGSAVGPPSLTPQALHAREQARPSQAGRGREGRPERPHGADGKTGERATPPLHPRDGDRDDLQSSAAASEALRWWDDASAHRGLDVDLAAELSALRTFAGRHLGWWEESGALRPRAREGVLNDRVFGTDWRTEVYVPGPYSNLVQSGRLAMAGDRSAGRGMLGSASASAAVLPAALVEAIQRGTVGGLGGLSGLAPGLDLAMPFGGECDLLEELVEDEMDRSVDQSLDRSVPNSPVPVEDDDVDDSAAREPDKRHVVGLPRHLRLDKDETDSDAQIPSMHATISSAFSVSSAASDEASSARSKPAAAQEGQSVPVAAESTAAQAGAGRRGRWRGRRAARGRRRRGMAGASSRAMSGTPQEGDGIRGAPDALDAASTSKNTNRRTRMRQFGEEVADSELQACAERFGRAHRMARALAVLSAGSTTLIDREGDDWMAPRALLLARIPYLTGLLGDTQVRESSDSEAHRATVSLPMCLSPAAIPVLLDYAVTGVAPASAHSVLPLLRFANLARDALLHAQCDLFLAARCVEEKTLQELGESLAEEAAHRSLLKSHLLSIEGVLNDLRMGDPSALTTWRRSMGKDDPGPTGLQRRGGVPPRRPGGVRHGRDAASPSPPLRRVASESMVGGRAWGAAAKRQGGARDVLFGDIPRAPPKPATGEGASTPRREGDVDEPMSLLQQLAAEHATQRPPAASASESWLTPEEAEAKQERERERQVEAARLADALARQQAEREEQLDEDNGESDTRPEEDSEEDDAA